MFRQNSFVAPIERNEHHERQRVLMQMGHYGGPKAVFNTRTGQLEAPIPHDPFNRDYDRSSQNSDIKAREFLKNFMLMQQQNDQMYLDNLHN